MQAVNKALEWITKVAYLNIIWIAFSVVGLVAFGLFPATAACFTVTRKWITGYTDIPVFKTFWKAYRESYKGANILGYIILAFGYILYLDFLFLTVNNNESTLLLTIPFLFISILYILTVLYIFPVYVYYDMKISKVLKSAVFIMLLNPLSTLVMVMGLFGIMFVLWQFQGIFIFFSMSIISIALMMPAYRAFQKIQEKQTYINNGKLIED
ncbi:YesL family protein [Gracilibacillus sp. YIM 98692]|uniref:YesL family protein n=1 Tax=Gracilibacillus sp. YIM 98692 TaxID=2663532 RepID=UPI0013D32CB9|nr:YesL family protein [Gracilibacillus sp. YIM 98692]